MGALRRILTILFGLVFLGLAVLTVTALVDHGFAVAMVDWLRDTGLYYLEKVFVEDHYLWAPIAAAAVLFIIGLLVVIAAFKNNNPPKQLIISALDGDSVSISFNAIDNIVRRAASAVKGVSEIHTRLMVRKNALYIRINVSLDSDVTVCEAGALLRREVSQQLSNILGVEPAEILVSVNRVVDKGTLPAVPVKAEPVPAAEGEEVQVNG